MLASKYKFIFGLICILVTSQAHSQDLAQGETIIVDEQVDILLSDPFLSLKYQRGSFMVYDCYDDHWVCTSAPEFKNCIDAREIAIAEKRESLPCASIKQFETELQCNIVQKRLTDRGYTHGFCHSEDNERVDRFL